MSTAPSIVAAALVSLALVACSDAADSGRFEGAAGAAQGLSAFLGAWGPGLDEKDDGSVEAVITYGARISAVDGQRAYVTFHHYADNETGAAWDVDGWATAGQKYGMTVLTLSTTFRGAACTLELSVDAGAWPELHAFSTGSCRVVLPKSKGLTRGLPLIGDGSGRPVIDRDLWGGAFSNKPDDDSIRASEMKHDMYVFQDAPVAMANAGHPSLRIYFYQGRRSSTQERIRKNYDKLTPLPEGPGWFLLKGACLDGKDAKLRFLGSGTVTLVGCDEQPELLRRD